MAPEEGASRGLPQSPTVGSLQGVPDNGTPKSLPHPGPAPHPGVPPPGPRPSGAPRHAAFVSACQSGLPGGSALRPLFPLPRAPSSLPLPPTISRLTPFPAGGPGPSQCGAAGAAAADAGSGRDPELRRRETGDDGGALPDD
ncbi:hypothetical protein P7K49_007174, partial [Saguinus oedipus]